MSNAGHMLKVIGNWILLVLAVVLGVVGAFASFFLAALVTSSILGMSLAAVLVCLGLASGLAWRAAGGIFPAKRARVATGVGVATTLLSTVLAAATLFWPLASPAEPAPLPPQAGYWDLPTGSHIAYLKVPAVGVARATPIIRVHGGPGAYEVSSRLFTAFYQRLAQDSYEVYLYDQIGGGLSARLDNPKEYTVARHVADLEAVRQKIGAEQVILLGDSWGGTLVANYMAVYPEHVARAIFTSPAPINYAEWDEFQDINARLPAEQRRQIQSLLNRPRFMALMILAQFNLRAARNFVPDREIDSFFDSWAASTFPGLVCDPTHFPTEEPAHGFGFWSNMMTGGSAKHSQANPRAVLASNQTPVLILKGECDHIKWEVAYQYKTTLPNATLLYVPGAGHVIYFDRPDIYVTAVRAFLLDQPLPRDEGGEAQCLLEAHGGGLAGAYADRLESGGRASPATHHLGRATTLR